MKLAGETLEKHQGALFYGNFRNFPGLHGTTLALPSVSVKEYNFTIISLFLFSIHNSKATLWVMLVILTLFTYASFTVGLSAFNMLINNSVTFDKLGSINGIAIAMASITR